MTQCRKVELAITKDNQMIIDQQSKICNWLYNRILSILKNNPNRKMINLNYLFKILYVVKRENSFLNNVMASLLNNVVYRINNNFKVGNKKIEEIKYNSWHNNWFSLCFDKPRHDIRMLNNKELIINLDYDDNKKIFCTKFKRKANIFSIEKVKFFIISKNIGRYYITFFLEREEQKIKPIKNYITIDQNHINFFVGVDNQGRSFEFAQMNIFKYFDKEIDKLKSKLSKCMKKSKKIISNENIILIPSKRHQRLRKTILEIVRKKREQIKQSCYSIANWIAKNYDCVAIGSYIPSLDVATNKWMRRKMINQSTIAYFKEKLLWVMKRSGKTALVIDEKNTTNRCCICQSYEKKKPNVRIFKCLNCKNTIIRDINSCINIAKKAKLLSGPDYVKWPLAKFTYTVKWDYRQTKLIFTDELNEKKEIFSTYNT